jgi:hypothetical protein
MVYTDAELAGFLAKCRAANHGNGQSAEIVARGPEARPKRGHATAAEMREAREQLRELLEQRKRALSKGDWRDDAKILAEHYPEEFGEPHDLSVSLENPILPNAANAVFAAKPLSGSPAPPAEQEPAAIASEPTQSAPDALPAAPPVRAELPLLDSAFWQALLYGNPDGLVSGSNATQALRLVSEKLAIPRVEAETIDPLRAGQLRKLFRDRFGYESGEQAMIMLWRSAPPSPGAPQPGEDQTHCTPGVSDCPRSMPAWRREFHQEVSQEQRLLESMGGWPGGF